MEEIAMFRKESQDEDRGKYFFSEQPDKDFARIGNSLLRLTLECIWVWSKWFPIDPDTLQISQYKITFEKLVKLNVRFCKLGYFSFEEVEKNMPEQQVPIKILQECRATIDEDFKKNRGNPSPSKNIASQLFSDLRKELTKSENEEVFYGQKISKVLYNRSVSPSISKKSTIQMSPQRSVAEDELQRQIGKISSFNQPSQQRLSQTNQEESFKNLVDQLNSLSQTVQKLQENVNYQNKENEKLSKTLKAKEEQLRNMHSELSFQKKIIDKFQEETMKTPEKSLIHRSSRASLKSGIIQTQINIITKSRENLQKSQMLNSNQAKSRSQSIYNPPAKDKSIVVYNIPGSAYWEGIKPKNHYLPVNSLIKTQKA